MPGPKNGRRNPKAPQNRNKVPKRKAPPVCKYFAAGSMCHRGVSCKFSHTHPDPPSGAPPRGPPRRGRANRSNVPHRSNNNNNRRPQKKYVKSKVFERVLGELRDNENTAQECSELTDLFQGWSSLGTDPKGDPSAPKKSNNIFSYDFDGLADSLDLSALIANNWKLSDPSSAPAPAAPGASPSVPLFAPSPASPPTLFAPSPASPTVPKHNSNPLFAPPAPASVPLPQEPKEGSRSLPDLPALSPALSPAPLSPPPVIPKPTPEELLQLKENILKQTLEDYLTSDEPSLHWSLMWVSSSLNRRLWLKKRRSL